VRTDLGLIICGMYLIDALKTSLYRLWSIRVTATWAALVVIDPNDIRAGQQLPLGHVKPHIFFTNHNSSHFISGMRCTYN